MDLRLRLDLLVDEILQQLHLHRLIGIEENPVWTSFLDSVRKSLRWSPWECSPMMHCGVHLEQDLHGHWHLSEEEFCQNTSQVEEPGTSKPQPV